MTPDTWHMTPVNCDIRHMTHDTKNKTCDTKHMTHDTQGVVNIVAKLQFPSCNGLGVRMFWRYLHKGSVTELIKQLMTKVFVKEPRQHSFNKKSCSFWTNHNIMYWFSIKQNNNRIYFMTKNWNSNYLGVNDGSLRGDIHKNTQKTDIATTRQF